MFFLWKDNPVSAKAATATEVEVAVNEVKMIGTGDVSLGFNDLSVLCGQSCNEITRLTRDKLSMSETELLQLEKKLTIENICVRSDSLFKQIIPKENQLDNWEEVDKVDKQTN